jgi:hypothetical protein
LYTYVRLPVASRRRRSFVPLLKLVFQGGFSLCKDSPNGKVFENKNKKKNGVFISILIVAKYKIFTTIAKKEFFIIADEVGQHTKCTVFEL